VPSAFITNSSTSPAVLGRNDMKKICRPFFAHAGARLSHAVAGSVASFGVRFTAGCSGVSPSGVMRNTDG
jgi:hypothetical protein